MNLESEMVDRVLVVLVVVVVGGEGEGEGLELSLSQWKLNLTGLDYLMLTDLLSQENNLEKVRCRWS